MAAADGSCGSSAMKTYMIEASVPTGFETVAAEEAKEMFNTECRAMRGRITFAVPADRVKDILKLGGIDHCRVQILHIPYFGFSEDGDVCLASLQKLVKGSNWVEGLQVWGEFFPFPHPIASHPPTIPSDEDLVDIVHSVHWPGNKGSGDPQDSRKRQHAEKKRGRRGGHRQAKDKGKGRGQGEEDRKLKHSDNLDKEGKGEKQCEKAGRDEKETERGDNLTEKERGNETEMGTDAEKGNEKEKGNETEMGTDAEKGNEKEKGNETEMGNDAKMEKTTEAENKKEMGNKTEAMKQTEMDGATDSTAGKPDPPETQHLTQSAKIDGACGEETPQQTENTQEPREEITPKSHPDDKGDCEKEEKAMDQSESGATEAAMTSNAGDAGNHEVPCQAADGENPSQVQKDEGSEPPAHSSPKKLKAPADPSKPVFRVTCKRSGENHSFDSMSAAASFGSAVQTYFGWSVSMTKYNIEVVLSIDINEVSIGLTLTPESLHRRNLVAFGVTTLRPTICHNMLRMVKIFPGHVVCDPLCGTASISIQGALNFPALQLCGDNHPVAMEKTLSNHSSMNDKRKEAGKGTLMMDAVQWNACHLPLRDGIVDVFVSDLPFGKRVGRKFDNQKLYCSVLDEMARCGKKTSRAALLTGDVNNMVKAIQQQRYWSRRRCYSCNIGGISAAVFLLCRTSTPFTPFTPCPLPSAAPHPSPSSSSPHHPPPSPQPPHSSTDPPASSNRSDCAKEGVEETSSDKSPVPLQSSLPQLPQQSPVIKERSTAATSEGSDLQNCGEDKSPGVCVDDAAPSSSDQARSKAVDE